MVFTGKKYRKIVKKKEESELGQRPKKGVFFLFSSIHDFTGNGTPYLLIQIMSFFYLGLGASYWFIEWLLTVIVTLLGLFPFSKGDSGGS